MQRIYQPHEIHKQLKLFVKQQMHDDVGQFYNVQIYPVYLSHTVRVFVHGSGSCPYLFYVSLFPIKLTNDAYQWA